MPRLDKTGPRGIGPGTGWGRGKCFCRPCVCAPISKEEEKKLLEADLAEINKRLKELE
ncbi:MAG: DUF5320 domain-containing protein [Candidatus Nanoarchaeia archaeon]|nr:DUF5320 domain-containing protein [Candidatus Nanoarchaeia archaeon]